MVTGSGFDRKWPRKFSQRGALRPAEKLLPAGFNSLGISHKHQQYQWQWLAFLYALGYACVRVWFEIAFIERLPYLKARG